MENRITVREAITEIEIAAFWEQLYNYYKRDIFPDSVDGEQNHFLGGEYRQHMEIIHKRPQDRCYYLLFYQNEQNVGSSNACDLHKRRWKMFYYGLLRLP